MTGRGRFIALEGIEGVGKTTNLAFTAQWLKARGMAVLETREPGGTPLAEDIRRLVLSPREETVVGTTELLMMFAARAQHVHNRILPALDTGQWVLCDRFTDATYAYQGGGRSVAPENIRFLETLVQGDLRPDLILLLDVDVATGLARARARPSGSDRIEAERAQFFERVRQVYLARAQADPARYCVIDAAQTLAGVQADIDAALTAALAGWRT